MPASLWSFPNELQLVLSNGIVLGAASEEVLKVSLVVQVTLEEEINVVQSACCCQPLQKPLALSLGNVARSFTQ